MGSVWVAEHLRLRTQVAVKFLSTSMLHNTSARSRFDREAQLVAQVKSPHVVHVLDQGVTVTDVAQPYIVMELLEGEDLGQLIERRKTLNLDEAYFILDQVCAGLHTAHGMGLVHRDIKPENIFLLSGDRPFVKILDFGIARATQEPELQRLTHTGGVIGTAHYMSPEQLFEGKQVDRRTDLWALGVVLYRMLTGRLPFDGSTYGDLCLGVNRGVFTPASQLAALSPEVDGFMTRALATDRNARFSTAKEFAQELAPLVQRVSALPGVPITSGSLPGAVRASTGEPPFKRIGTGTEVLRPHTDIGSTVSVEAVPMNRSGVALASAIVGAVVLAGVAFAASRYWSVDDTKAEEAPQADTAPQAKIEPKAAAAGAEPDRGNTVAAPLAPASVPTHAAPAAPPEPSKAPPQHGQSPRMGTRFTATPPATATTSKPRTPSTSTSHDQASVPTKAPETAAAPPKEKYRGF